MKNKKLTRREQFLLNSFSGELWARKLLIHMKTLKMWTKWGMPHFKIPGQNRIYFNYAEVSSWFDKPAPDGNGTITDMLYRKTPKKLLPIKMYFAGSPRLAKGNYWLIPSE